MSAKLPPYHGPSGECGMNILHAGGEFAGKVNPGELSYLRPRDGISQDRLVKGKDDLQIP